MLSSSQRRLWPLSALALLCWSLPVRAGSFDAQGHFSPSADAVAVDDFEEYPPDPGAAGSSGSSGQSGEGGAGEAGAGEAGAGEAGAGGAGAGGEAGQGPGGGPPVYPYELVEDATALTGKRVFKIGPFASAGVGFDLPAEDASYVARVWVKGEAVASVEVTYGDGSAPVMSQMFPTGRVTSDGWVELESAPFSVEAARGPDAGVGFFSFAGVVADAFEVVKSGEFRTIRACTGINDATSCLPDEMCVHRHCIDARGFVPSMPSDEGERKALADYMGNRIQYLFGPLRNRELHIDAAMQAIDQMRNATDRYRFWFSFITAIQNLEDSHSSVFGLFQFQFRDLPGRIPLNVCFVNGDGDLTHDLAPRDGELPDVIVSHTGQGSTWGLQAGDRLVSIDGEHPIAWARKLRGRSWDATQVNDATAYAQYVEDMRGTITSLARSITVIRCNGTSTCGAIETLNVADQPPPTEQIQRVSCDHRPALHLPDVPPDHGVGDSVFAGLVNESSAEERIHGMVWDSLYGAGSSTGAQIEQAAKSWVTEKARGVILDHRTGNGGTKDAAMPILAFMSPTKYSEVQVWRTFLDEKGPADVAAGLALFDQLKDEPFSLSQVGSESASLDVPVALLITRDVSASDYFPNAFKGSPKARIFGPNPTNGAFSTFLGYSYWMGLTFQMASEDTINHDGTMLCARGVTPDEVVEPKQSDLVQGVDTVYAAALAWVRANLKPQETP